MVYDFLSVTALVNRGSIEDIIKETVKMIEQIESSKDSNGSWVFTDAENNSTECGSTSDGVGVPRRLLYPEKEKSSNPSCPAGDSIYDRLENDPF